MQKHSCINARVPPFGETFQTSSDGGACFLFRHTTRRAAFAARSLLHRIVYVSTPVVWGFTPYKRERPYMQSTQTCTRGMDCLTRGQPLLCTIYGCAAAACRMYDQISFFPWPVTAEKDTGKPGGSSNASWRRLMFTTDSMVLSLSTCRGGRRQEQVKDGQEPRDDFFLQEQGISVGPRCKSKDAGFQGPFVWGSRLVLRKDSTVLERDRIVAVNHPTFY